LIITLVSLFLVSGIYGFYVNNYKNFRFYQNYNHIKLYQMIPDEILKNLT